MSQVHPEGAFRFSLGQLLALVVISAVAFGGYRVSPHGSVAVVGGICGYLGIRLAFMSLRKSGTRRRLRACAGSLALIAVFYVLTVGPVSAVYDMLNHFYPETFSNTYLEKAYRPMRPLYRFSPTKHFLRWYVDACYHNGE
ncbi:MAG: hypothetical protein AAGD07_23235 [Planctomycetota bacterium]